jgi:hypothetical protein
MSAVMATERVRLVLVVPDEIRAALRVESATTGEDMSDLVCRLVERHFAESLAEVRRRRAARERGRKKGEE